MKQVVIKNINDADIQIYKTLRDNILSKDGSFIADSPKVVNVLLENNMSVKSILATKEYYDAHKQLLENIEIEKCFVADKALLEKIVGHTIHHNCMMHGMRPEESSLDDLGDGVLMLDGITSTQNVGAIARSMAGFGVSSYLLPSTSPHPYARRSLRVSMGYISYLKYHVYEDIFLTCKALKQKGYKIIVAELTEDAVALCDVKVPDKWVLIMGHEGNGISKEVLDVCDEVVSIEMSKNVKSLNVGVAASIIMHTFVTCKK